MAIDINRLWEEKANKLSRRLRKYVDGNEDAYQDGLLKIREILLEQPDATDSYLIKNAMWGARHAHRLGSSVDNGRDRPDYFEFIPMDMLSNEDLPHCNSSPDILAIDRICAEQFYASLTPKEYGLVLAMASTLYHKNYRSDARKKTGMGVREYRRIRNQAHKKFLKAFDLTSTMYYDF